MLDPGEECDDGNTNNNDDCKNDCTLPPPDPACGDGNIDAGEECGEPGLPVCEVRYECQNCNCDYIPQCGNGMLDPGEECDDGNTNNDDDCRNDCTLPEE
jgi:cysteine-rich repeat protein